MSTITTLNSGDSGPVSRGVLNTNLANLNTDKIETSVISTDGTMASNSDAKLPSEKAVKTYVDASSAQISFESTAGATHSLTTIAGQSVMVSAKGSITGTDAQITLSLKYNGVTKDSLTFRAQDATNDYSSFSLMYTETPGADTQDITVTTSAGTLGNVVIMVIKIS